MVIPTLLGYLMLVIFFHTEGRLRRGTEARSFEAGQFDRQTTRFLGIAYFVSMLALLAAWILSAFRIGRLSGSVGWLGIVLALSGLLIRAWANRVLGAFYTRTLKVADGQTIVKEGPYRLIRHPGYLGMILMWVGVSVATGNWIVMLVVIVVTGAAYYYRIYNEEKMLASTLPGYSEYRSQTWRLITPIY